MSGGLVVIGDLLLDRDVDGTVERISPDAPVPVLDERAAVARPGGAGLAAAIAAASGHAVTLIAALADDDGGRLLRALVHEHGIELIDLGLAGTTPEKVRLRAGGRPLLRLDRGDGGAVGPATAAARAAIGWADVVLVSDYGRGIARAAGVREALAARAADGGPTVWDPHPRGAAPVRGATLASPNAAEAAHFAASATVDHDPLAAAAAHAAALRERWGVGAVCVTRGAAGALLDEGHELPLAVPAPPVAGGDPCGAGDCFAATVASRLVADAPATVAVEAATVAAARFVAAGGASAFARAGTGVRARRAGGDGGDRATASPVGVDPLAAAREVIAATRSSGGVVVATGGCFDLLHAGHVRMLQAARALGDCLVVCLNSDASVRRLKGPSRPLVGAAERAAVLGALACVDAVVPFEEDTPRAVLERLRPDVWAKGADYAGTPLPEAAALERWGGRAVLVPHHAGHSTTRLIQEAANRAAS